MAVLRYEIQCDMSNHYRFQLMSSSDIVLLTSGWLDNQQWSSLGIQSAQVKSKSLSNYRPAIIPDNKYYFDLPLMNECVIATSQRYSNDALRDATLMATIAMGSTREIVNTCTDNPDVFRERHKTKL